MKVLHSSDWHLGQTLYSKKRYEEHISFLKHLLKVIDDKEIDILLVSGDIFDTTNPSNYASEIYYKFLFELSNTNCKHIVITAGNHDSPSFLKAPKELLSAMNIHVVSQIEDELNKEVIELYDEEEKLLAIICAVPYIRERELRTFVINESIEEERKNNALALKKHYKLVCNIALEKRKDKEVPIIAMGHLFTSNGKIIEGDGVRDLYVGNLSHIDKDIFPDFVDYVALGHLHLAQKVDGCENIRYSGTPIPMGFNEAKQIKKVVILDFNCKKPKIEELELPIFQKLEQIKGDKEKIFSRIKKLKEKNESIWIEIDYEGKEIISNLVELIKNEINDSLLEVLKIKNKYILDRVMNKIKENETLEDLNVFEVFNRRLEAENYSESEVAKLKETYKKIITEMNEKDQNEL